MKPIGNKILIKADREQKSKMRYGTLELYMPPNRDKLSENGRETNPVVAEVISGKGFEGGEMIVLHHNIISNLALLVEKKDNYNIMAIPVDRWIIGKLDADGNIIPLNGNLTIKRKEEKLQSIFIIIPDGVGKKDNNVGTVINSSLNAVPVGSQVLFHTYSDYEVVYFVNGQERRTCIINLIDIVGVN
jgi:co-chaperonin GroES (HSP10)